MNKKDLLLSTFKLLGNPCTSLKVIGETVFKDLNTDQINHLILEIKKDKPELINDCITTIDKEKGIKGTGMIESFLENGGFEKIELDKKEKINKEIEVREIELELSKSNIKANKLNEKNSNFNKWTTLANIIIGLLNIGLLIWQITKD